MFSGLFEIIFFLIPFLIPFFLLSTGKKKAGSPDKRRYASNSPQNRTFNYSAKIKIVNKKNKPLPTAGA
jgi:hypothetical protein